MEKADTPHLILGITGASGIHGARLLVEKSPWPIDLVASRWGRNVAGSECGGLEAIETHAKRVFGPDDLYAPLSSGSVPAMGMVVLPCSAHTLAQIAAGLGDSLITRAAHCQLKERRPLILCLREAPLTLIDLENARRAAAAGALIMPMSPPFFMFAGTDPKTVSMDDLLDAYVDRVLALLGRTPARTWEDIR
ncbi:MAG: UbiX family flavin prenyltransferase [Deltaproteobacteria bacterium]|nr:UbiX family flavin prenyltransferase [Deltaproteobacteria bacterium]